MKGLNAILTVFGLLGVYFWYKKSQSIRIMENTKLSENFNLGELTQTTTGLPNEPNEEEINNLRLLVKYILQPLREAVQLPVIVNSAFRSFVVNTSVGGAENSQHRKGLAADIRIEGWSNERLINAIKKLNLPYDQLIDEQLYKRNRLGQLYLAKWVHVSFNPRGGRGVTMLARNTPENLKTQYSIA